MKQGYVYTLASKKNGTLCIGVTSDLLGRIWQHKNHTYEGFTKKYNVHTLVWYDLFSDITDAIYQEKKMKKWNRAWKIRLIEETNPEWKDLYQDFLS